MPTLGSLLLLAALGSLVACSGSCGGGRAAAEGAGRTPGAAAEPSGPPVVVGTTLDAATGRPVEAALVAPDGSRTRSDGEGRFLLRLPQGTAGVLVAETGDGRRGQVALRPLQGGRLEVVIHLRRP